MRIIARLMLMAAMSFFALMPKAAKAVDCPADCIEYIYGGAAQCCEDGTCCADTEACLYGASANENACDMGCNLTEAECETDCLNNYTDPDQLAACTYDCFQAIFPCYGDCFVNVYCPIIVPCVRDSPQCCNQIFGLGHQGCPGE